MKLYDIIAEEKTRLDPACWTGKKIGNPKTKVKGGVRVNNCVPAESVAEDVVTDFVTRGGQIQQGKLHKPRKGETWQGSSHIGAAGGRGTKGTVSGRAANTNPKGGKPVVTAEDSLNELGVKALSSYGKKAEKSNDKKLDKAADHTKKATDLYAKGTASAVAKSFDHEDQANKLHKQVNKRDAGMDRAAAKLGNKFKKGVAEAAKWRSDPDAYDVDDEGNKTPRNPNSPKFGYDPLQRRADTANDAKTPRGKTAALKTSLKMAKGNKGVAEGFNGEYDDEAGMADNNLETLRRAVDGIDNVINTGDNLPEWCQEKIAVAKSMLVTVWDYMRSEEQIEDPEISEMYEAMQLMAESMAHKHRVSVDLVWESFEALDDHMMYETAAWRRKEGKSAKGGLNAKGVASYRRENPGSKLQTAVTTKPSKLKPGSKAAKRRKSFCARMSGVNGPAKKPNGKPTRKTLALRKWNC